MIGKDSKRIVSIIPDDLYKLVENDAELEDRSISSMVAYILKKHYNYKAKEDD